MGVSTTLSPGATMVTPSPTTSTIPAASCPSTDGLAPYALCSAV